MKEKVRKISVSLLALILCVVTALSVTILTGEQTQSIIQVNAANAEENRAVWFSYYDFEKYTKSVESNTAKNFRAYFKKVVNKCENRGLNRIIVQVRPCGDALYQSKYFPTSEFIVKTGKQGTKMKFDPLKIMVQEAHKKGLKIEAWINPYRVAFHTNYKKLAKSNQARKWHYSKSKSTKRNVLAYDGKLYYNPSKAAVRKLIINGVTEIAENYDVDGIHMDDYFYPQFTTKNYKKVFDAVEYKKSQAKKDGKSIVTYRRNQVDLLVKGIKKAVKKANPDIVFGISPAGNIDNLTSKTAYYVNIKKWTNSTEYVDYIAPQVYWGFHHRSVPFDEVVDRWVKMTNQKKVKLYIGIPAFKVGKPSLSSGSAEKKEFKNSNILTKMINYGRKKKVDGFMIFDYEDLNTKAAKKLSSL